MGALLCLPSPPQPPHPPPRRGDPVRVQALRMDLTVNRKRKSETYCSALDGSLVLRGQPDCPQNTLCHHLGLQGYSNNCISALSSFYPIMTASSRVLRSRSPTAWL